MYILRSRMTIKYWWSDINRCSSAGLRDSLWKSRVWKGETLTSKWTPGKDHLNRVIKVAIAGEDCGCHMSLKWHHETGAPPLSVVCFPKVHKPCISMRKHPADPNGEAFYKYLPGTPQQYQIMKTSQAWETKETWGLNALWSLELDSGKDLKTNEKILMPKLEKYR